MKEKFMPSILIHLLHSKYFNFMLAALLFLTLSGGSHLQAISSPALITNPVIREQRSVIVDSKIEYWRLEWRDSPQPTCDPCDDNWYTCPCHGFAFGERGELDLIRQTQGMPEERLSLSPLFEEFNDGKAMAILPKWPVRDEDIDFKDSVGFSQLVNTRPVVTIMDIADYDHDGRATEFLLQISARPCGHRQTVLVGISRDIPRLHVFGTIASPNVPLVLESPESWKSLLHSRGDTTIVEWLCGDHGIDEEIHIELHTGISGIKAYRLFYECGSNGKARLLRRNEL